MSENLELREQAFADYQQGMKYREIAEKYGVSLSAVKSWATRYWKKNGCNQNQIHMMAVSFATIFNIWMILTKQFA